MSLLSWLTEKLAQKMGKPAAAGTANGSDFSQRLSDEDRYHSKPPGKVDDAALILDRDIHSRTIENWLRRSVNENGVFPPLLAVLHGPESGGHGVFFRRFADYDVRERFKSFRLGIEHQKLMPDWHGPDQNLTEEFLRYIAEKFDWRQDAGQRDLVINRLANINVSVYLHYNLTPKRWQQNQQHIRQWIDFVCNEWPHPPPRCLVVVFLLVSIPEPGKDNDESKKLRTYIDELVAAQAVQGSRILVGPELGRVELEDVKHWVLKAPDVFKQVGRLTNRLQSVPGKLFPEGQEGNLLEFDHVFNHLVDFLNESNTLSNPRGTL